jgi:hypothetical protein
MGRERSTSNSDGNSHSGFAVLRMDKEDRENKNEFSFYTPNPFSFISPVCFQAIPAL